MFRLKSKPSSGVIVYIILKLNVHNVSDVSQIEVHTAEPIVPPGPSLEVEIAIAKLKKYRSPDSDKIPAELIQSGGKILMSASHKLVNFVWNKEELPDQLEGVCYCTSSQKGNKTVSITAINFIQILSNIL
jgi:hypothetical protein